MTNYGKLGLSTFLTEIYLHPSIISQNNLVIELFGNIPYVTQCYLQNGKILLYIVLPNDARSLFRDYLNKLQHSRLITHFKILQLKSYETTFSLNRSQNKHAYISSFLPFTGRQWFLFNRPLKKMHDLIDKHYNKLVDYTPSRIEFLITPLHLLLLLSKREIFRRLYQYSTMRDFLSNTKKTISLNIKMREIPPKIQNIKKFSETYAYLVESGFFYQFDNFKIAKDTLESCQGPFKDSIFKSLPIIPLKYLKSSKKIIDYADSCNYLSPASLENYSSDEFFNETSQIISELSKTSQYSQQVLEKKINQLFSSQALLENRGMQVIQFFSLDPRYFMVQIRSKNRLDWLERVLFSNFLFIFESENEITINYQIMLSADYWRVFIRFLILTPLDCVELLPVSLIPTPTHNLLFFYNYSNQRWDLHKFSLSKNRNHIASLTKKYLPSNARTRPFDPVHDEKSVDMFSPFSLPKFMQGVFILRKDNEIAQKMIKSTSPYFEFLRHTFLTPTFEVESAKNFLRGNYTFEFAQIQRILAILPKQRSESKSDLDMVRYLLIIHDYLFPCHPLVLHQNRLLAELFCQSLKKIYFSGGIKEGVLVLEYLIPNSLVSSFEIKFQIILNKIEQKYMKKLKLQQITDEFRFVSPEYTPSSSLEIRTFQHLIVRKTDQQINHSSFVHIPQSNLNSCSSRAIPDAFWQVIGHPVTIFIHIMCSEFMKIPIMNMIMQLPIGQILVSEGDSKPFTVELMAWVHLAEAINYVLDKLSTLLEKEEVRYYISPIIDYSIINDPNLNLSI